MAEDFPLLLPGGMVAKSLLWEEDCGWTVEGTTRHDAPRATWTFGKTTFGRHLCLHRFKLWWLKPSHGDNSSGDLKIPPETSLLLAERRPPPGHLNNGSTVPSPRRQQQEYVTLLPISDTHARSCLHGAGDDDAVSASSGCGGNSAASVTAVDDKPSALLALSADTGDAATLLPRRLDVMLVATGPNPFRLVRKLVQQATNRLRAQLLSLEDAAKTACLSSPADPSGVAEGGCAADATPTGQDVLSGGDEAEQALAASFIDTFGWCTWDSFYTMVSPAGILEGLSTLREGGVRPRWVVIDDGWQRTTNDDALNTEQWDERLVGLEANKRFRRVDEEEKVVFDLGDAVGKIKRDFGVDQVLAWHAMTGYWAGVEPEAQEMAPYDPCVAELLAPKGITEVDPEMQPELDEKRFGMVNPARVEGFYSAYHRYLKESGIDGVKVDAQSILDCMGGGNGGVPAVTRAYHEGLRRSVQATFEVGDRPAAVIHCMCHASSVLFHIACLSQGPVVIRGSDDFYPREDASHGPHLYSNAFNALLLSNLGIQDWDMFQTGLGAQTQQEATTDAQAGGATGVVDEGSMSASWFHAAARAISGGPVYVSDRPGQHNRDILGKLVLEDGSVLRASTNALPTLDSLLRDPQRKGGGLLQVWALNTCPGTAVVGSFNIQGASFDQSERTWVRHGDGGGGGDGFAGAVKGTVSPSDVHAFCQGKPSTTTVSTEPSRGSAEGEDQEEDEESREAMDDGQRSCQPSDSSGSFAVYFHRRREAIFVGLHEAVEIEVLPMSFELTTFSRVADVRLSPLKSRSSGSAMQQQQHEPEELQTRARDAEKGDHQEDHEESGERVVKWAPLGLANMFNSSAAVTAQEATIGGTLSSRSRLLEMVAAGHGESKASKGAVRGMMGSVSLSVKGSGTFIAMSSRKPTLAILGGGGRGGADNPEGSFGERGGVGFGRGGDGGDGHGDGERELGEDGLGDSVGAGGAVPIDVSFSPLPGSEPTSASGGPQTGTRMGVVEVDIPGPWDGRERSLVFSWD